jgi:hypothetical protein
MIHILAPLTSLVIPRPSVNYSSYSCGCTTALVCADRRWLGFEGEILDAPFYEICRTQLDIAVKGGDERLAEEIRGFHWMVVYGGYLREVGYAVKKIGLDWLRLV